MAIKWEFGSLKARIPSWIAVLMFSALAASVASSAAHAEHEVRLYPSQGGNAPFSEQIVSGVPASTEPILNGVLDWSPSVGMFLNGGGLCSGTLIGCQTFLTAAHCVCSLPNATVLSGQECRNRADLLDPSNKVVFFQHVGIYGVSSVEVDPDFEFGAQGDLAILHLAGPVPGIRSSRINQTGRPAHGSVGEIVGFGDTLGGGAGGLKFAGLVQTAACTGAPEATHICWNFVAPIGTPGNDSSTCHGDSGGPLFMDFGSGLRLVGVTSGGDSSCLPPNHPYDADTYVGRSWIQSAAGPDLHRTSCGSIPFAGEAGGDFAVGADTLSGAQPNVTYSFDVPAGIGILGTTLNGDLSNLDADLYLRRGAPPTLSTFDCKSTVLGFPVEACFLGSPQAGTWYLLVHRVAGAGPFQITVTLFAAGGGGSGDPPPPAGPWLSSPALPGFDAKVLVNNSTTGNRETNCIPETLCVSAALAGRPEIFVKVIGPRPNGFLWSQISRFTPSKVEIWLRKTNSGQINYYVLDAVGSNEANVSGLQDREAFSP